MKLPIVAVLAVLPIAGLTGCQNSSQPRSTVSSPANPAPAPTSSAEAQIRTAIQAHLAQDSNLNLQAFDTDVKQVTVNGDHAEAQVDFHLKGGPGVMQLTYELQNREGAWSVIESNPVGDFSHPPVDQAQAPGAASPIPGGPSHSLADELRSFKQEAGGAGAQPALPSGHPPLNGNSGSTSQ